MPKLTTAQHRKVCRLLESRTNDAARNIWREVIGIEPDEVGAQAMEDIRTEIFKVFYPLVAKFVAGEKVDEPATQPAPPPAPSSAAPENPKLADLHALVSDVLTVPDIPRRLKESAQKMQEWLDA